MNQMSGDRKKSVNAQEEWEMRLPVLFRSLVRLLQYCCLSLGR